MKPSILIIYTGGTIGMKPDPTTGALVPFDFSGIFEEFPTLQSLNIGIEVFTMDPVIDSSNVSPRNWLDLAAIIRDNYARYDGFVGAARHRHDVLHRFGPELPARKPGQTRRLHRQPDSDRRVCAPTGAKT